MPKKKAGLPCLVCNPLDAGAGEYCETHREELHRLDHRYETLFRIQRNSRGKDHETYGLFLQGECDPCGRILVTETDPENLAITVLLSSDLQLDSLITEYTPFGIRKTYGDQLRTLMQEQIIYSWFGNARACVDIFPTNIDQPQHWDVAPRDQQSEDDPTDTTPSPGGNQSIH